MLKRVDELTIRADDYVNDLCQLMPAQYRERPDDRDHICAAWRRAAETSANSHKAIATLRELVAQKVRRAEQLAAIMDRYQAIVEAST